MATATSKIQFTISAVDKATKTLLLINNNMNRLLKPGRSLGRSFQNFAQASGINRTAQALGRVGHAALRLGSQMKRAVEHMAEFVSIGSVAGIATIAVEWGRLSVEIARTAQTLGMTTSSLQEFRGAGALMGVTAEAAGTALKSMGDTIEDALYGRNQMALAMMGKLNIHVHRLASGAIDSRDAVLQLADAFQSPKWKGNVQAMAMAARSFGQEGILSMLMRGRGAILAAEKESLLTGYTQSDDKMKAGADFGYNILRAENAVRGLRNEIGSGLVPVLSPLIDKFVQWEEANKGVIASDVAGFVQRATIAIPKLWAEVNRVVEAFGGWKRVAQVVGILVAAKILAPTVLLTLELAKLGGAVIPMVVRMLGLLTGAVTPLALVVTGLGTGVAALSGALIGLAANWVFKKLFGDSVGGALYDMLHPKAAGAAFTPAVAGGGPANLDARARHVQSRLMGMGYSREQALGMTQRLAEENSRFDPTLVNSTGHAGIAQLSKTRQAQFKKAHGIDYTGASLDQQIDFVGEELRTTERSANADLRRTRNVKDAHDSFRDNFERPEGTHRSIHVVIEGPPGLKATVHGADTVSQRRVATMNPATIP